MTSTATSYEGILIRARPKEDTFRSCVCVFVDEKAREVVADYVTPRKKYTSTRTYSAVQKPTEYLSLEKIVQPGMLRARLHTRRLI